MVDFRAVNGHFFRLRRPKKIVENQKTDYEYEGKLLIKTSL